MSRSPIQPPIGPLLSDAIFTLNHALHHLTTDLEKLPWKLTEASLFAWMVDDERMLNLPSDRKSRRTRAAHGQPVKSRTVNLNSPYQPMPGVAQCRLSQSLLGMVDPMCTMTLTGALPQSKFEFEWPVIIRQGQKIQAAAPNDLGEFSPENHYLRLIFRQRTRPNPFER